jgi:hypothetical protein
MLGNIAAALFLSGATVSWTTLAAMIKAIWPLPGVEFSLCPFWFWNDELHAEEIERQMADFQAHGVDQFVLHPRVGLPKDTGWMSQRLLGYIGHAIAAAERRGMRVVLYDEGMYPSGSSSGQVVAENADFACRGLVAVEWDGEAAQVAQVLSLFKSADDAVVEAVVSRRGGQCLAIVCRKLHSGIRGLHYKEEPPEGVAHSDSLEEWPPAADLLNPESVKGFIRLVYQRYYEEFGAEFGGVVPAIFTDEPSLVGKLDDPKGNILPGTRGIVGHVSRILGYDFTPHLACLWYPDEPGAQEHRANYLRALELRLEETYYQPISQWCIAHGVSLMGHPAHPDALGQLRYFQIPGQDVVWRWVEPGKPSGTEGRESTCAKAASSAMLHRHLRRNANEFCGAFGANLTFEEMRGLAGWLLIRGCNLLLPHAFFYSMRGPRRTERPPDVGPHSPWWEEFRPFADACRRLCWLNTDSKHMCDVAILGSSDALPWESAKHCFERQIDFNYIEVRQLLEEASISADAISLAGMTYRFLIIEPDFATQAVRRGLAGFKGAVFWPEKACLERLQTCAHAWGWTSQDSNLRVRRVVKDGAHYLMVFNEGSRSACLPALLALPERWDPASGEVRAVSGDQAERLEPFELGVWTLAVS